MHNHSMATRIAQAIGENPDLAFEFYCMASEVVDDFEDYDPVLQADEDGLYTESTTIMRLTRARNELIRLLEGE